MKIAWETLSRQVRDVVQKEIGPGQRYNLPERMVAQVKEPKKQWTLLRWEGKVFAARVDVPVKKGEYLLLRFKGIKEGKLFYQVQARSFEPIFQEGSRYPTQHILIQNSFGIPFPLLYRYYEEKGKNQNEDHQDDPQSEIIVLDFAVDTQNLGLIILRISRKQDCYFISMLVESEDKGQRLKESLEIIQQALTVVLKELKVNILIHPWELLNPNERRDVLDELFKVSYVLDERV